MGTYILETQCLFGFKVSDQFPFGTFVRRLQSNVLEINNSLLRNSFGVACASTSAASIVICERWWAIFHFDIADLKRRSELFEPRQCLIGRGLLLQLEPVF